MPANPTIREQWQAYAKGACKWCAVHLGHTGSDDAKATGVLPQSAPNFVHKVYPPLVNTPLSQYLRCTAMTFEAWAEWRIERLMEALDNAPCKCKCFTHGYGCGLEEATCKRDWKNPCYKCKALAAQPESGVTK